MKPFGTLLVFTAFFSITVWAAESHRATCESPRVRYTGNLHCRLEVGLSSSYLPPKVRLVYEASGPDASLVKKDSGRTNSGYGGHADSRFTVDFREVLGRANRNLSFDIVLREKGGQNRKFCEWKFSPKIDSVCAEKGTAKNSVLKGRKSK